MKLLSSTRHHSRFLSCSHSEIKKNYNASNVSPLSRKQPASRQAHPKFSFRTKGLSYDHGVSKHYWLHVLKLYVHSKFSAVTVTPKPCRSLTLSRKEGITWAGCPLRPTARLATSQDKLLLIPCQCQKGWKTRVKLRCHYDVRVRRQDPYRTVL
jgi:hypothetical protein